MAASSSKFSPKKVSGNRDVVPLINRFPERQPAAVCLQRHNKVGSPARKLKEMFFLRTKTGRGTRNASFCLYKARTAELSCCCCLSSHVAVNWRECGAGSMIGSHKRISVIQDRDQFNCVAVAEK